MKLRRREFLGLAAALAGCRLHTDAAHFDAAVSHDAHAREPVFASLGAAIAAAPADATAPWRIRIDRGRWHEKVVVDKPNIHLVGVERSASILCFDAAAGQLRPDGNVWGTI
jgi:pectinesterase